MQSALFSRGFANLLPLQTKDWRGFAGCVFCVHQGKMVCEHRRDRAMGRDRAMPCLYGNNRKIMAYCPNQIQISQIGGVISGVRIYNSTALQTKDWRGLIDLNNDSISQL